ncbi:low specificity L-threonine aldolase [Aliihoeflea aestuarii]|jgi:threonine aldolase|uniref:threonine aldolase family protein n=1 Tax=Aliihoeflea aestuarii TaxID=453840 RepID=UPI00209313AD|nr:low specificity L-threonine aldolase [Aliihoeflea aestuarii]MCO6391874.1 low specificity L-threonine aldolase [Aliihoeflea aestuarii]
MHFASDNWAGAHPDIARNLVTHSAGFVPAYGASEVDRRVEASFSEIFEREVAVFFVGTGTAANSLALTAFDRAGGVSFCHREAHVAADECGAPEYFMGGSRLHAVDGSLGRIDPARLKAAIERFPPEFVHGGRPAAVTITQASEVGTVYTPDAIDTIAALCREHDIPLHMDGARFANALVSLDISPAEMTWKRGVDVLSFGGTKNGCWCAEAVVFFDPGKAKDFPFVRKRAAQLFSKSRFIAAQFEAYFADDLWLKTARHSNAMAARLAGHFTASPNARLGWRPEANEVFPILSNGLVDELKEKGAVFYAWPTPAGLDVGPDETLCRFVTSFATTEAEVDEVARLIG